METATVNDVEICENLHTDDIDTEDYRVEEIDEKASYKRKYQREPFILMKDQIEDQY